jgi:hypothetical protein
MTPDFTVIHQKKNTIQNNAAKEVLSTGTVLARVFLRIPQCKEDTYYHFIYLSSKKIKRKIPGKKQNLLKEKSFGSG